MIHESGNKLSPADKRLLAQREVSQVAMIEDLFNRHPFAKFTAEEVHQAISTRSPLTSIRRALSDLKKKGFLLKHTFSKKPGQYGILITQYYKNKTL